MCHLCPGTRGRNKEKKVENQLDLGLWLPGTVMSWNVSTKFLIIEQKDGIPLIPKAAARYFFPK
jgi:hypothetical protein